MEIVVVAQFVVHALMVVVVVRISIRIRNICVYSSLSRNALMHEKSSEKCTKPVVSGVCVCYCEHT